MGIRVALVHLKSIAPYAPHDESIADEEGNMLILPVAFEHALLVAARFRFSESMAAHFSKGVLVSAPLMPPIKQGSVSIESRIRTCS